MRILIVINDYSKFRRRMYRDNPGLEDAGYDAQMAARNNTLFGVADYYSRNFRALGHDAIEVHINNRVMQNAWAREHGLIVEPPCKPDESAAAPQARYFAPFHGRGGM